MRSPSESGKGSNTGTHCCDGTKSLGHAHMGPRMAQGPGHSSPHTSPATREVVVSPSPAQWGRGPQVPSSSGPDNTYANGDPAETSQINAAAPDNQGLSACHLVLQTLLLVIKGLCRTAPARAQEGASHRGFFPLTLINNKCLAPSRTNQTSGRQSLPVQLPLPAHIFAKGPFVPSFHR